ncbi:MAG: phosphoadenylyl-sulfate reductase [Thermoflexaceae bacterium]|nr:phosphoadenylyl-sulfate reductase [Thermoflexaceae bacterium]
MTSTAPAFTASDIHSLNGRFETADPREIVCWAFDTFGSGVSIGASFGGASGMAILHMAGAVDPGVHVFVLDTGYLFEETLETMRRAVAQLGLSHVQVYRSLLSHEEQAEKYGSALWMRDPDLCCELRKVEPNRRALAGKTAWLSGLRRDQSEGRADTPIVSWSGRFGLLKVNPLATWTEKQTWAYLAGHGVPYNPLLDQGYTSIGCYNCTVPGKQGRQGRWEGFAKDECGLHSE